MSNTSSSAGTKRPLAQATDELPTKKRRVHHSLHHVQSMPSHIEPAPQDPLFVQGQLLKSITAALTLAGFESVKPTALEMFRSHTEQYMQKFLEYAKIAMHGSRRSRTTVADFEMALALMPNTITASRLQPQLGLQMPENISCPSIVEPNADPPQPPDFSLLLMPLTNMGQKVYIPKHFPRLPPRHAWMETPVFPEREKDARKMREKATQEGMLAEQALRKLAAAAKAGAMKAERDRSSVLHGPGKTRDTRKSESKEEIFTDLLKDVGADEEAEEAEEAEAAGANGSVRDSVDVGMPEGVVVNYDMGHWRRSGTRRALRM